MKALLKMWMSLRGSKRQAGAIVALLPVILNLFGLEFPQEWTEALTTVGALIWGIGWTDKGAREVVTRLGGTKQ